jgi:hypothetical protein
MLRVSRLVVLLTLSKWVSVEVAERLLIPASAVDADGVVIERVGLLALLRIRRKPPLSSAVARGYITARLRIGRLLRRSRLIGGVDAGFTAEQICEERHQPLT